MSTSEIAHLCQRIQAEYEAAERGFSGLASGMARHSFITARAENIAKAHEQLIDLVGTEEAIRIIAHTVWTPEERGETNKGGNITH